ncbi:TLDc domain-containing protein [Entamoeba marina]
MNDDVASFMKSMNKWTNKTTFTILYDTDVHGWEYYNFREAIMNKPSTMILCINEDGLIFGSYLEKPITEEVCWMKDDDYFVFFLKSKGKVTTPAQFKRNNLNFCGKPYTGCFGIGTDIFISFFSITIPKDQPSKCYYNQYTHELFVGLDNNYFLPYKPDQRFDIHKFFVFQWYND